MSMTAINASIAASSAANNAMAQQAAHRARVDRCAVFESQFDAANASAAEKQEYAACVETLYPAPTTEGETILIKTGIVVLLIALVIGLIYGWKEDGAVGSLMFGLMSVLCAFLIMIVILLTVSGVGYLFT